MPQAAQMLQQLFGKIEFTKQENIDAVRHFYTDHSYALNDAGDIIALASTGSNIPLLRITQDLGHLQYLNLGDSKNLKTLDFKVPLPDLVHLDLSDCVLKDLVLPEGFSALKYLDISRNQLQRLEIKGGLPALTFLDLSKNQLKQLRLNAPKLQYAYLLENELTDLVFQASAIQLEVLHLRNNQLEHLPDGLLEMDTLNALYLYENPLSSIPSEIISEDEGGNSLDKVKSYLQELKEGEIINVRAKLIIIGNGRVGKTSMYRRMANESFNQEEAFTHGIQLGVLEKDKLPNVKTEELQLQVWDFGGQEIFYATHQFFLSEEAVYILAWTDEKNVIPHREKDKETLPRLKEDYNLEYDKRWRSCEYWLENIRHRAKESPIIMVQTHSDIFKNKKSSDPAWEQSPYSAIPINFSAAKDFGLAELREILGDRLNEAIPMLGEAFPETYEKVIQQIETIKKEEPRISYTRYLELCRVSRITEGNEENLLDYLFRAGIVVYYFDKPSPDDVIYINPNWLTTEVYKLIDNKLIGRKGKIDNAYLEAQLRKPDYDKKKRAQFIELLKKFELIFEVKEEEEVFYMAPLYLPEALKGNEKKLFNMLSKPLALAFIFRFPKFIPDNVMINFLSRYGPFSDRMYWKNGICFAKEEKTCVVEFNAKERCLHVRTGKEASAKALQREICKAFVELSRNANAEVSLDGKLFVSWQKLQKFGEAFLENPDQQIYDVEEEVLLNVKDYIHLLKDEHHSRGEVAKTSRPKTDQLSAIEKLIGASKLEKAIEELLKIVSDKSRIKIIEIQQRLSSLEKNFMDDLISLQDLNIGNAKITKSLLRALKSIGKDDEIAAFDEKNDSTALDENIRIYFSYAWGAQKDLEEDAKVVNQLYTSLISDGFNVHRDKMDLSYGGLISQFMEEIGQGDLIVVFVSEKYAKSPYCMFELYEIARNNMLEKRPFTSRILPVVIDFIKFDEPAILREYINYWKYKEQEWANLFREMPESMGKAQAARYDMIKKIKQNFGDLSDWLVDINASSIELLSKDDFQKVKQAIKERIQKLKQT